MVTVATSLDAPIKILFPKSKYLFLNNSHGFALLGGGDIIVPGLWCGLCLRYDWWVPPCVPLPCSPSLPSFPPPLCRLFCSDLGACVRLKVPLAARIEECTAATRTRRRVPVFNKPFFATSLVAYILGLGATIGAMQWSKAAQPALLYIRYVHPPLSLSLLIRTYVHAYLL
jgi:minor histocompatibility antigen H13